MDDFDDPPPSVVLDVARRYARGGRVGYDEGGPVSDAPPITTADILRQMPTPPEPSWHDRYIKPLGSAAMQERGPWSWTKDHPELANFLAAALQYAPAAMGARTGPLPSRWEPSFHGTANPKFALEPRPIWSELSSTGEPGPFVNRAFGQEGAIAPLRVDTADYLTAGPSLMAAHRALANRDLANWQWETGPAWINLLAKALGKKGVVYKDGTYLNNATYSIDPGTVRSR